MSKRSTLLSKLRALLLARMGAYVEDSIEGGHRLEYVGRILKDYKDNPKVWTGLAEEMLGEAARKIWQDAEAPPTTDLFTYKGKARCPWMRQF